MFALWLAEVRKIQSDKLVSLLWVLQLRVTTPLQRQAWTDACAPDLHRLPEALRHSKKNPSAPCPHSKLSMAWCCPLVSPRVFSKSLWASKNLTAKWGEFSHQFPKNAIARTPDLKMAVSRASELIGCRPISGSRIIWMGSNVICNMSNEDFKCQDLLREVSDIPKRHGLEGWLMSIHAGTLKQATLYTRLSSVALCNRHFELPRVRSWLNRFHPVAPTCHMYGYLISYLH